MMNAKKSALFAAAVLALSAGAASAESLNFSLSDDAFRFGLTGPLSRVLNGVDGQYDLDRKSTRLNPVINAHLVCLLLLKKKKQYQELFLVLRLSLVYTNI